MENELLIVLLLGILPYVAQGLKKIPKVEENQDWLLPLVCIGAAVGTAFGMKLENWLITGLVTGIAAAKMYDWTKNIPVVGAAKLILPPSKAPVVLMLLVPVVLLAGCLPGYGSDPNAPPLTPELKLMALAKTGNAAIQGLTAMKKVGVFDHETNRQIGVVIDTYVEYLVRCQSAMEQGTLSFDMLSALSLLVDKMLDYQLAQGGGVPPSPVE